MFKRVIKTTLPLSFTLLLTLSIGCKSPEVKKEIPLSEEKAVVEPVVEKSEVPPVDSPLPAQGPGPVVPEDTPVVEPKIPVKSGTLSQHESDLPAKPSEPTDPKDEKVDNVKDAFQKTGQEIKKGGKATGRAFKKAGREMKDFFVGDDEK